jgi:20S proteasome alpha/beta subunit
MNNPRKTNERITPVTIIVGIICKDCIALSSDSQTSYSPGTSKRCDVDKIVGLKFKDGKQAIVAQAGDAILSSGAIEMLQKLARENEFDDYRKPAELAEVAVKQLKGKVAGLNHWTPGDDASVKYWKENEFALMLAYYYQDRPFIYSLPSWPGMAMKEYNYATAGCGSTVAEFILSRSKMSEMEMQHALITAIYTVEQVKKVDAFCGGQTKLGVITKDEIRIADDRSEKLIKATVKTLEKYDEQIKSEWKKMMETILGESLQEYRKDEH